MLLLKFGFHQRFVDLIANNLSGSWFSVLVNGVPSGFFRSSRGLKQGDPLSPLLFLLVVEALSRGITQLLSDGLLIPYSIPGLANPISHFCFADDLIIFLRGQRSTLREFFKFLRLYELATGQLINAAKSTFLISKFASQRYVSWLTALSGIPKGSLPMRYLGNCLFKGPKRGHYFQHILDKLTQKLAGWQGRFLSFAGRLILIKHVLSAIPLYCFAALSPPKSVIKQMERIMIRFLWGADGDSPRRVWRKWSNLTFPLKENGLAVRDLTTLLQAYSCKLWWKWRCQLGPWSAYVNARSWKKSVVAARLASVDDFMRSQTRFFLKNGTCSFLYDDWSGNGALVDQYSMDSFEDLRGIMVREVFGVDGWNANLLRELLPDVAISSVVTYHFDFEDMPDSIVWQPDSSGRFSLKSAYEALRRKGEVRPVLQHIWSSRLPPKISVFTWRLLNGLLPFPEILQRMGFHLPSKCYACDAQDTIQHCFVDCPVAAAVWDCIARTFCLSLDVPLGLFDLLQLFWSYDGSTGDWKKLIQWIPSVVCWALWCLRCAVIFDGSIPQVSFVLHKVFSIFQSITVTHPLKLSRSLDMRLAQQLHIAFTPISRFAIHLSWLSPPPGRLKLNVDGSSLGNPGHSGGGIVLRDCTGHVLFAQSCYFAVGTSLRAELLSLLRGLEFCLAGNHTGLEIETDSKLVVGYVNGITPWPWRFWDVLPRICQLISFLDGRLVHIFREVNAVADSLAKLASFTCCSFSFQSSTLPRHISGLCALDCVMFPYVRLVHQL